MPVRCSKDKKGCFCRWGSQKKYYYKCNNKAARERAKEKAGKQARAAYWSGYKG